MEVLTLEDFSFWPMQFFNTWGGFSDWSARVGSTAHSLLHSKWSMRKIRPECAWRFESQVRKSIIEVVWYGCLYAEINCSLHCALRLLFHYTGLAGGCFISIIDSLDEILIPVCLCFERNKNKHALSFPFLWLFHGGPPCVSLWICCTAEDFQCWSPWVSR